MTELLRYVTLDIGGRPVIVLDLADQAKLAVVSESFAIAPESKQPIMSSPDRRFSGSRQVAETTDNGTAQWTMLIKGEGPDGAVELVEQVLAQLNASPIDSLLEWRPDGVSQSGYYEVRGTASWVSKYLWKQFSGVQSWAFDISIPVAPLAKGLPYDIGDNFAVDTRGDYTYDAGAVGNEEVTGGQLLAAANVNVEQRAIHTARGYLYGDNQQTIRGTPGATITGWKNGVIVKRLSATTYIVAYVEDNGANSILKIDKVVAGVPTNLATTNLAARVKAGAVHWVRGRIEGNTVTAEYFLTTPTPMGAPTSTITHTLTGGEEINTFGEAVKGAPGRMWVPKTVGAAQDEYEVAPFTYRNLTLPETIVLAGSISGDAPAQVDVTVTPKGGAAEPIWALLAMSKRAAAGLASAPFGIFEGQNAGNLKGWSVEADGGARSGKMLKDAAALSTDTYSASFAVDPSLLARDAFQREVSVEVFTRVKLAPTIVSPVLTLSTRPEDGLTFGSARYTDEWGSSGKLLTVPSGFAAFKIVRLGTLRMLIDPLRPRIWLLWLEGAVGAGSSGEWGLDYLWLASSTQRACSPTSKANDAAYPVFVSSTAETSKTIKSDLSALVSLPPKFGHPDHGLGGQLLELSPGENELFCKLSSLVPDDPTPSALSERLSHSATVHGAVTPRWNLMPSGS